MTEATTLPPYPPGSVGEQAALAAYAVLRARNLIQAGDWSVAHEIGAETQAIWEKRGGTTIPASVKYWGPTSPPSPINPNDWLIPTFQPPQFGPVISCGKCGMKWAGAMGYVCPDSHCPVQVKVTC